MTEAEKGRERATSWPLGGAGRRLAWAWPAAGRDFTRTAWDLIKQWAAADVAPGRLLPWLPVSFGAGIALYFAAEREPALWAAAALTTLCIAIAILARRRPLAFPAMLAVTAASAGFTIATWHAALIAHPVLNRSAYLGISGWVEVREERDRSDRIVVRVRQVEGGKLAQTPQRVRVAVRKKQAPPVGSFVEFHARLGPPVEPLRPGGYDFARDLYFQKIGASGFVMGRVQTLAPPAPPDWSLRLAAAVSGMRDAIDRRIRVVVPGDEGSIASALITGKRGAISQPVNNAMYVSSLAHVLAISGYHMAIVAGVVFFVLRAGLALIPLFASRYPIKKFAAAVALAVSAFYLVLSGAKVATQRSFIMLAIVLIGVMLDRPALTFRTLAVAALAVLLLSPQAVVHPSFQMSFAAALALIAAYQRQPQWLKAGADTSLGARSALWGGREVAALILASVVAGLATMPYVAYHFHRLAPYGVLANLLAMPIVSFWIMPAGILGVLTLPFGFDGAFWRLMGHGIAWMDAVALWVASLPGALGRIGAFGTGPLLLGTAGLILICLLRSPLRLSGAALAAIASLWALATPAPDLLVAPDGRALAVRGPSGLFSVAKSEGTAFAIGEWLAADGDGRAVDDPSLGKGVSCDDAGCLAQLADGKRVSLALSAAAFAEDCRRAAVVVTPRQGPRHCAALLIDREVWRRTGAVALKRDGNGFEMIAARPPGYDRPWARAGD
jgi:competence protein ComEC